MYVNGEYRGDNQLGKLMHDFSTSNADDMYYDEKPEIAAQKMNAPLDKVLEALMQNNER